MLVPLSNNKIWVLEEVDPLHFPRNNWQANNFFGKSFVFHGTAFIDYQPELKWDVGKGYIIRQRKLYMEIY